MLKRFINETGIQPKPAIIFALIHIAIIATRPLWGVSYPSPFSYTTKWIDLMYAGQVPYADFDVEYPPLGFLIMAFNRMITSSSSTYEWIITIETIVLDLIGLLLIWAISRRLGYSFLNASIAATVCLLAVIIVMPRDDIFPAIVVLASLYAFVRGWDLTAWILLAIGIMTKFYPAIIIPLFALHYLLNKQHQQLCKGITSFTVTLAIITIPILLISMEGFWNSITFHMDRGLEFESTYGSYLLLGEELGICSPDTCTIVNKYNSLDLGSSIADTLADISFFIMAAALLAVYTLYCIKTRGNNYTSGEGARTDIINYFTLAILVFMVTNKTLQPQYFLWIFMLLPLVANRWRNAIIIIFFIAFLPLSIRLSWADTVLDLIPVTTPTTLILIWRNTLLIVMAFLLLDWRPTRSRIGA